MAYLGTKPQSGFISQEANQYFTGLTQNYIDLNQSISSLSSVIVLVNGVVQENSTMSLTSSTRITLGDTLVSADKVTCIYVAKISSTQAPATGTVTNDMLSGSIANSKLSNSSITLNGSAVSLGGSATVGGDNTPAFHVYRDGNFTVADSTYTKMEYNAEIYDTDNCYDNSSNYRFTPTTAGNYFLYAVVQSQDTTDINDNFIIIRKNGTDIAFNNTPHLHYHTKAVFGLAVANGSSDYFEIFVFNNTGGSSFTMRGLDERSYFGGYKIIT